VRACLGSLSGPAAGRHIKEHCDADGLVAGHPIKRGDIAVISPFVLHDTASREK
jgi:hypothetical protein